MKILYSTIMLIMILFISPLVLGGIWNNQQLKLNTTMRLVLMHLLGFFTMLAIWQLLVVPLSILHFEFSNISYLFSFICFLVLVIYTTCQRELLFDALHKKPVGIAPFFQHNNKYDTYYENRFRLLLYIIIFFVLLAIQSYFAICYSRTYMSDDGYVAYSTMALSDGYIFQADVATGVATFFSSQWIRRIVQTELYFPAYISFICGIDAATICHTVFYAYITLLSYEAMYLLCSDLFSKKEDKWLFLIFVSLLYIFGYHSHYSLTFRLLGPNDEGKAILAVVMTPLMLWLIRQVLEYGYSLRFGLLIMMLSIAGMSLTLGGAYTFAALLISMVILGLIHKRDPRFLLLGVFGTFFPIIYGSIYAFFLMA